jgi:rhodanese-related sulfurtransferase
MKTFKSFLLSATFVSLSAFAGEAKLIHSGDLAALVAKHEAKLTIVDANNKETRTKYGVIPGAMLLSSSSKFDVSKELPADKSSKLVFYCANEKCQASHQAAKKAAKAGFTDVAVMTDGIMGWKSSGQPTEPAKL